MATVSIIIPMYNVEKYIHKCIESLQNQTLKDIEIILVNDGSSDRSGEIADQYALSDRRIKVIRQNNRGVSAARNSGLNAAQGEFIGFVDGDDWVSNEMYKTLYEISIIYDADISMCKFVKVKESGDQNKLFINTNKIVSFNNIEILNQLFENHFNTGVVTNKLYKKKLFETLRFPIGKIYEDAIIMPKLLYNSNKVVLIENAMYYYRQTPNSLVRAKYNTKQLDILDAYEQKIELFREIGNEELYLHAIKYYGHALIYVYFEVKCYLDNSKPYLNNIRKKYNAIYDQLICNSINKYIDIIAFMLFRYSPCLFKFSKTLYEGSKSLSSHIRQLGT